MATAMHRASFQRAALRPMSRPARIFRARAQETQTATETQTTTAETETRTATGGEFSLSANRVRMEGYTERDTAGQTNMFPVVQRPYEAGSSADTGAGQEGGTALIGVAAVAAVAVIAVGLTTAGLTGAPAVPEAAGNYQTLTQYKDAFASELGLNKPVVPVIEQAPEVQAAPSS